MEAFRHGDPESEAIPPHRNGAEELADVLIRVLDLSRYLQYDIGQALIDKMKYNETRPKKHGKEF